MGIYQKFGVRKMAIYTNDLITLVRTYGLKNGMAIINGFSRKNRDGYSIQSSLFRQPVFLRDNFSDREIFRQVFMEQQYKLDQIFSGSVGRIIDAGANIGCASLYFAWRFPAAEIVAIEPEAGNFRQLQKNTTAYPTISCKRAALWHKDEVVSITNPDDQAASFMVQHSTENSIPGIPMDQILKEYGWEEVDIVKIDIEGAEKEVFSGDTNWLKKTKLLIIELHDRYKPGCTKTFFNAIAGMNYEAFFQHENIFILFNKVK